MPRINIHQIKGGIHQSKICNLLIQGPVERFYLHKEEVMGDATRRFVCPRSKETTHTCQAILAVFFSNNALLMYRNPIIGTHKVDHWKTNLFFFFCYQNKMGVKISGKEKKDSELLTLAGVSGSVGDASWFQFPDEGVGQTSRNRNGVDTLDFSIWIVCNS